MLPRSDHLTVRTLGTLLGLAWCVLGVFLLFAAPESLPEVARSRAVGLGMTLIVVGVIAMAASLMAHDIEGLWYRKPRRMRMLRGKPTSWKYGDF
jgi:threonine/homoserine/homoserine lactone efflux protein